MFESAELGHTIDKETFERELPRLRAALLRAQFDLRQSAGFPVVILVSGLDGAGKGDTVNRLNEWMDPRLIETEAFDRPTREERERPPMWRFWRALPPKGRIGIFLGSWYSAPLAERVHRRNGDAELDRALNEVVRFERMLADEGALILKFWLHLSKARQKARLASLEADPATRWRVRDTDWKHYKLHDRFCRIAERVLRETSTAHAPWTVVEGYDARYRSLTVGRTILEALGRRLDQPVTAATALPAASPSRAENPHLLRALDLTQRTAKDDYESRLEKYQGRLSLLTRRRRFRKTAVVVVFEGMDAAGKGGAIRRIAGAIDARRYRVHPIAAPTDEERAQPYLWRFWRHLPRRGHFAIFDRSWYGRVLVERVEGYAAEYDWARAYHEINDFEEQMVRHGIVVVKFWLQITLDEQLRRFGERKRVPFKRFKITDEDWRNRDKWPAYEKAVCDVVDRTSTEIAPWTLVEANDKYYARIKVLKTLCERIKDAL